MKPTAALFALLLLVPASHAEDRGPFAELAARGDVAATLDFKLQDYNEAIKNWKESDGKTPRGLVYERIALICTAMGAFDQAETAIKSALEDNPNSVSAYFTLARIHTLRGKCDEAVNVLNEGTRLIPPERRAPFIYQRAMTRLSCSKDNKMAEADFKEAAALAPKAGQTDIVRKSKAQLGQLYCRQKHYRLARQAFGEAGLLAKKPSDYDYLLETAKCNILKGDDAAAMANYTAYTDRAIAMLDEAEKKKSRAVIDPAIKRRLPEVYCRRGILQENAGNTEKARKDFDRAISLELETAREEKNTVRIPTGEENEAFDIGQCYFHRAVLYADEGEKDFAAQDYEEACKRQYQPACALLRKMKK